MSKIAVLMVRGFLGLNGGMKETLYRLNLKYKLSCAVLEDNPSTKGMINKVQGYVTFGEITDETYKLLIEKRGKTDVKGNPVPYFRMHPPRGGFERKGIKKSFTEGGALGYRGDNMNDLLLRMI